MQSQYVTRPPELREFLQEEVPLVHSFIRVLFPSEPAPVEILTDVFESFASYFRKRFSQSESVWDPILMRIELFRMVIKSLPTQDLKAGVRLMTGRDTRALQAWDQNLLASKTENPDTLQAILKRLTSIDLDYRLPVILKDILKFEDDAVMRVLGIRWGVYRHRLHRGRLGLAELLVGNGGKSPSKKNLGSLRPDLNPAG